MIIRETIGIDISKLNFDIRVHSSQAFEVFDNKTSGFKKMLKWAYTNTSFSKKEILFVFEHTGLYFYQLAVFLTEQNIPFSLISGLEIKRSLGITRGKDDKIDATKIALYGYRLRDEIQPYKMQPKILIKLKHLITLRDRLVRQRAANKATLTEQKRILNKKEYNLIFKTQEKVITVLSKQIECLEKETLKIVSQCENLSKIYKLVTSVKGIGSQTAPIIQKFSNTT